MGDKTLDLQHTGVPKSLEGRGIGKVLANEAFEYCHQNGFKMKLSCWYLEGYLQRHPVEKYSKIVV